MSQLPATRSGPGAIVTFVVAVLVLSWLRFIPLLLERAGVETPGVVVDWLLPALGSFGPLIVALVLVSRLLGRSGVRALLKEAIAWRVGGMWYLVALLGPSVLVASGFLALLFTGRGIPALGVGHLLGSLGLLATGLVFMFGEELGWRSYLQRRLQSRTSSLITALLIGVVWAGWHAPLFVTGDAVQSTIPRFPYFLLLLALSVLFAWVYNATGSALLVVLAHGAFNAWVGSLALEMSAQQMPTYIWGCAAAAWIIATAIVLHDKDRWLQKPDHFGRTRQR